MRKLFTMDACNYFPTDKKYYRPSVRGLIIVKHKIILVFSKKYQYYKFPGGGIKNGENQQEALIREVKEELGLTVLPQSIKEYGLVSRIEKGKEEGIFIQDNYYYFCDCKKIVEDQKLDDYERFEEFTLAIVDPLEAIKVNEQEKHGKADLNIILRDTKMLKDEGFFA